MQKPNNDSLYLLRNKLLPDRSKFWRSTPGPMWWTSAPGADPRRSWVGCCWDKNLRSRPLVWRAALSSQDKSPWSAQSSWSPWWSGQYSLRCALKSEGKQRIDYCTWPAPECRRRGEKAEEVEWFSYLCVDSLVTLNLGVRVQWGAVVWGDVQLHQQGHRFRGFGCRGNDWYCCRFCKWERHFYHSSRQDPKSF